MFDIKVQPSAEKIYAWLTNYLRLKQFIQWWCFWISVKSNNYHEFNLTIFHVSLLKFIDDY